MAYPKQQYAPAALQMQPMTMPPEQPATGQQLQPGVEQQPQSGMDQQQQPPMGQQVEPQVGRQVPPATGPPPVPPQMWHQGQPVPWQPQMGPPVQPGAWQPGKPVLWQQGQPVPWQPQMGPPSVQPLIGQPLQPQTELQVTEPKAPRQSRLPIVDRGCGFTLKTGCKVQGWAIVVGLIGLALAELYAFAYLVAACPVPTLFATTDPAEELSPADHPFGMQRPISSPEDALDAYYKHLSGSNNHRHHHQSDHSKASAYLFRRIFGGLKCYSPASITFTILSWLLQFMLFLSGCAFLWAIEKKLALWMRVHVIMLSILTIMFTVDIIYIAAMGYPLYLLGFVFIGFLIYCIICGNSLRLKTLDEKDAGGVNFLRF